MRVQVRRGNKYRALVIAALFVVGSFVTYAPFVTQPTQAATPHFIEGEEFSVPFATSSNMAAVITSDAADNIYVAGGYFQKTIQKFNAAGELLDTFIMQNECGEQFFETASVGSLVIGGDGTIYASLVTTINGVDYSCIQAYDAEGIYLARIGTIGESDGVAVRYMALDGAGHLFVAGSTDGYVRKIDIATGAQVDQFGGKGDSEGTFGQYIVGMQYYEGKVYVADGDTYQIQVFNSDGEFERAFVPSGEYQGAFIRAIEVGRDGHLYISGAGMIEAYDSAGNPVKPPYSFPSFQDIAINTTGRLYMLTLNIPDNYGSVRWYDPIILESPEYTPINIAATNIQDTSAVLSWEADPREQHLSALRSYQTRLVVASSGAMVSGSSFAMPQDIQYTVENLRPGTSYTLYVATVNADGMGPEASYTFTTTGTPPLPIALDPTKRTLTLTGEGFLNGGTEMSDIYVAFERSLVTLNGVELKACTQGIGMTRSEIVAALSASFPNIGNNVTDSAPCYMLIENQITTVLTDNQVIILLPDEYDFNARGTVRVNGGDEIVFNDTSGSGGATIQVNGINPASGVLQLPKKLSFSGVASPGAVVTVTVHSDPVTCTATADANGNWSCTLPSDLPNGNHTVYVHVTNLDASIEELGPYSITVSGDEDASTGGGTITNETPLAPNTGILSAIQQYKEQKAATQRDAVVASAGVGLFVSALGAGILWGVFRIKKRNVQT